MLKYLNTRSKIPKYTEPQKKTYQIYIRKINTHPRPKIQFTPNNTFTLKKLTPHRPPKKHVLEKQKESIRHATP